MDLVDHALDALLGRSQSQAGPARRWRVHSSEREAQEVELAFRDLADLCLVLIHCQLQLTHDFAQAMQRRFGVAPPAQDHEVIGIGDKASAKTLLKAELLPTPAQTGACRCSPVVVRGVSPAECRAACRAPRSCVSSGLGRRFLRRGSPTTSSLNAATTDTR